MDTGPAVTPDLTPDELAFLRSVFDAVRAGDLPTLEERLDVGVPVDLTNDQGDTLLLLAAYHGHADAVRALLARGADHARVNDRGQTALAAAAFRRRGDIVTDLLAAGADPALGPRSALDVARFFDLPEMVALLERPPTS